MCPRFKQMRKQYEGKLSTTRVSYLLNSYIAANGDIWQNWLGTSGNADKGVTKETDVYRPATVVMFTEENPFAIPGYSQYKWNDMRLTVGNAARQIDNYATFHNSGDPEKGGANIAFVDGHVEFYRRPVPDRLDYGFRMAWPRKTVPFTMTDY